MPDLTPTTDNDGADPLAPFRSHPNKPLRKHIKGVTDRTEERTKLPIARAGALLHDTGKINPNFQLKIANQKPPGYSNHAYLSAITLLRIAERKLRKLVGLTTCLERFALALIIARHHGHLPNCNKADHKSESLNYNVDVCLQQALSQDEYVRALTFLHKYPTLPWADVTACLLDERQLSLDAIIPYNQLPLVRLPREKALDFFLETQFAFAALIESDKRDASDNAQERRREHVAELTHALTQAKEPPKRLPNAPDPPQATIQLNEVRTAIRDETLKNLQVELQQNPDQRVFSLTAPTGSGKTLTLLALSTLLLQHCAELPDDKKLRGVLYCLPFLSITEQVESVCRKLLGERADILLLRADSRADNPALEKALAEADGDPEAVEYLLKEIFAETVFDSPLVVTTFVQFFESLMSNRNSVLLKLPNFARSVILIDEIQALPPRLYTFFAAYLDAFCRKFNAYAILSSATMPSLGLPNDDAFGSASIFIDYQKPPELLLTDCSQSPSFQRYTVQPKWEVTSLDALAQEVETEALKGEQGQSVLVILNTIADTTDLFDRLQRTVKNAEVVLLNTRFTPRDRKITIAKCDDQDRDHPLIVVTTQLVEAGVDIDFPIVFRDFCPVPSLIQSAGRCNRHNKLSHGGTVFLVQILGKDGKPRARLVYDVQATTATPNGWYLNFTREKIQQTLSESQLLDVQRAFFNEVNNNMQVGHHPRLRGDIPSDPKSNLILCIRDAAFADAGKLQLIQEVGEQYGIYVPENAEDSSFAHLEKMTLELISLKKGSKLQEIQTQRTRIASHLRKMADRIVQVRLSEDEQKQLIPEVPIYGIYRLGDLRNYTSTRGLCVADGANFL